MTELMDATIIIPNPTRFPDRLRLLIIADIILPTLLDTRPRASDLQGDEDEKAGLANALRCRNGGTVRARSRLGISGLSILQGQLDLLPFAPRLLSHLRIKHPVTQVPARLDTGPVASGYPSGNPTR
jgi:hypothetical protein